MTSGQIFDIQRFSIDDGPGIRTTVFLKGCNMRCFWCHNPESLSSCSQVMFFPVRCIGCGKCIKAYPGFAHQTREGERIHVKDLSKADEKCGEVCNAGALVPIGKTLSDAEVMKAILKDEPFYRISGGGVTFSGGEPLLQKGFLVALLAGCKAAGLHTAIDTAGNVDWDLFEEVIPWTDLFLFDIKCVDEKKHKAATGSNNRKIISNVKRLAAGGPDIWIRIPVIPGVNDSVEEMSEIAELVRYLNGVRLIELLPFHKLGKEKYEGLGMAYGADALSNVPVGELLKFEKVFIDRQMAVKVHK